MAYFQIADFRGGLDVRRSRDLAPPGTLRVLRNGFINEGAEVEKRPAFVKDAALTALLQGSTVAANIAGGDPAGADDRPIGPFPGLTDSQVLFAGSQAALWSGAQKVLESIAGSPTPTAHYTQLLDSAGASLGAISRIRTWSVTEFEGNIYLVAGINSAARHFLAPQPSGSAASVNEAVGTDLGGSYAITKGRKIWTVDADLLRSSHLGEPTNFDLADPDSAGAFQTLLRGQDGSIGAGVSLSQYFDQLAVFGQKGIQFWATDPDPARNQYLRTIPREGVIAPRAARGFGDGDVVFLSRSGVRSLQARDSSNLAKVGDVGSPIDGILRPLLREAALSGSASPEAHMHIHQLTGQLWVAIGRHIYVLSNHPESEVLAWAEFELPSPTSLDSDGWIEDIAELGGTMILRNRAREVFVYGGPLYDQYDATECVVETPYLSFGTPAHPKQITGIDIACEGHWRVEISLDPPNIDHDTGTEYPMPWEEVARIWGSSYGLNRIPCEMKATHIAVRCTSLNSGPAKLGEVIIHFEQEQPE